MNDKTLNKAYDSFWGEVAYRKPKKRKQIRTVNVQIIRRPNVQRMSTSYKSSTRPSVRSLPTQRQQPSNVDYYKQKAMAINQQANYLTAQKRLYEARVRAREAGYRTPYEKSIEYGRTGVTKTKSVLGDIAERVRTSQRTVGLKSKTKAFFKKSIYD